DDAGHGSRDHRPWLDDAGASVVSWTAAPLGTPEAARASFASIATPDQALVFVTTVRCGATELLNLGGNQVFAVVHRFVQCLGVIKGRKPASLLEGVFQH